MISTITNRDWPIVDCKGILNCTSSDASGAWVIQWLNMDDQFEVTVDGVVKTCVLHLYNIYLQFACETLNFKLFNCPKCKRKLFWPRLRWI
ncbi:hypothetical protein PIB30_069680 [Stylosanthes scabra]|uniref:Uncharacterized protein n=1 Tax=Stylosanthes scabra TaxID=79078 RepID=A0ABU6TQF6_9FABA|nr:hypothetical protein [Stylosanthes scabra]